MNFMKDFQLLRKFCIFFKGPSNSIDGYWSWVVCAANFCNYMCSWGLQMSFGIIFNELLNKYDESRAKIAWIGSIASTLLCAFSLIAASSIRKYGHRRVAWAGAIITSLSLLASSFAPSVNYLFLTYGVLLGFGTSLIFTTACDTAKYYCKRHYNAATVLFSCGIPAGAALYTQIYSFLLKHYSLETTFQCMAVVILIVSGIPSLAYIPHLKQKHKSEDEVDTKEKTNTLKSYKERYSFLKCPSYLLLTVAVLIANFEYLVSYAQQVRYAVEMGIPYDQASNIPTYMAIGNTLGRLSCSVLSSFKIFHGLNMMRFAMLVCGTTYVSASFATTYLQLVALVTTYNTFAGVYNSLVLPGVMWTVGTEYVSDGFAFVVFTWMIPTLLASPLVGFIVDTSGDYKVLFYVGGGPVLLGFILLLLISFTQPWHKRNFTKNNQCRDIGLVNEKAGGPTEGAISSKATSDLNNFKATKDIEGT